MAFNSKQITIGKVQFFEVDSPQTRAYTHRTPVTPLYCCGVVPLIPTTQLAYRPPLYFCVKIVSDFFTYDNNSVG